VTVPERRHQLEAMGARESPERRQVAVVVVIMAQENDVNWRQILDANSWRPDTSRAEP
jgi:hypothetical protein